MKLHRYRNPTNNEYQNILVESLTYEQGNNAPSAPHLSQNIQLCSNITTVDINNSNIEKTIQNQINIYENITTITTSQECRVIVPITLQH